SPLLSGLAALEANRGLDAAAKAGRRLVRGGRPAAAAAEESAQAARTLTGGGAAAATAACLPALNVAARRLVGRGVAAADAAVQAAHRVGYGLGLIEVEGLWLGSRCATVGGPAAGDAVRGRITVAGSGVQDDRRAAAEPAAQRVPDQEREPL